MNRKGSDWLIEVIIQYGDDPAPALKFMGTVEEVQGEIVEVFKISPDRDLSLGDLIAEVSATVQGVRLVQEEMGGRLIEASDRFPQAADEAAKENEVPRYLLEVIDGQTTVAGLKEVWARNKEAFEANEILKAAYMNKGKSLKSGG